MNDLVKRLRSSAASVKDGKDAADCIESLKAALVEKERKIVALREGLSFYADEETYHACAFMFDKPTGGFDEDFEIVEGSDYDRPMPGKLARATLRGDNPCETLEYVVGLEARIEELEAELEFHNTLQDSYDRLTQELSVAWAKIEELEAELGKLQEAYNTIMNSGMIEALEAESDEFERTVMRLELAEERVKELEAALRKSQEALKNIATYPDKATEVPRSHKGDYLLSCVQFEARAAHAEIEKVLK